MAIEPGNVATGNQTIDHESDRLQRLARLAVEVGANVQPGQYVLVRGRVEHAPLAREIARAALDGSQPVPAGAQTPVSQMHIRVLLGQIPLGAADLDVLAMQLTAALDGPLLLYLSASDLTEAAPEIGERIAQGWQDLVRRVCRA
jgi:hypothetical protein